MKKILVLGLFLILIILPTVYADVSEQVAGILSGGYSIYIWATIFVIAYLIIMIVYNAFAKQKGESENELE